MAIRIDLSGLQRLLTLPERAERAVKDAARDLSAMGHAKTVELATAKLHVRRSPYLAALSIRQESESTWLLVLDAKATWIENGLSPHDQLKELLASPKAKTSKDGGKYIVVPFRHGPAQTVTPAGADLVATLKSEMKKRGIPWAKIEHGDDGKPLYGRLHSFDVNHAPLKTHQGPGQGHGPVGDVRQGMNARQAVGGGPGGGGHPFLAGASVYQRDAGGGRTQRDIMSFRVASSKHLGTMRWKHPGLKPVLLFDEVHEWLRQTWDRDVRPAVIEKLIRG